MKSYFVGEINFENYLEEIGQIFSDKGDGKLNLPSIGKCRVMVYSSEGSVPHFHLENSEKKFDTCICIYSNAFFTHGRHTSTFNSKARKALDKWLSEPNSEDNTKSNWEFIRNSWEDGNPDCSFPELEKVNTKPDYTKMNIRRS